ncbi:uncharacterized protein HD556DRAFT_1314596 [Suillus plorans]|uniref:Uncharacterized protein n=1 Tax=Suillus plorans TaxID=116603 RepID=A0A9P7A978_9AGAM|nr:uncharacterized protein HD556DRAFT_1315070 [Suillus plorans]XP_041152524.1 uncharacterized protein HD556DRAFT_1314584 [Suillus plorans]XP_041152540.1 uncharacterized protein HD556DRAFT_1314596 [Suillus plorans]KAG1784438.1 hypothetical protein HD556DRAFT_1315070 [Suillus plorans]KAG1785039.1 hypothetical protein HD556DRAFT_1314584 [Suillus plorans]KAG1785055.1 hypothetical protein HD556DRAFT_1314596 [Suillus plorans]
MSRVLNIPHVGINVDNITQLEYLASKVTVCTRLHSPDPTPKIGIAQVLVHTYMTDPHIYTRELAMSDEEASAMRRFQAFYASRTSASISKHVKSYGPAPGTVFHEGLVLATSTYKGTAVSLNQIRGIAEVVRLSEIFTSRSYQVDTTADTEVMNMDNREVQPSASESVMWAD